MILSCFRSSPPRSVWRGPRRGPGAPGRLRREPRARSPAFPRRCSRLFLEKSWFQLLHNKLRPFWCKWKVISFLFLVLPLFSSDLFCLPCLPLCFFACLSFYLSLSIYGYFMDSLSCVYIFKGGHNFGLGAPTKKYAKDLYYGRRAGESNVSKDIYFVNASFNHPPPL